MGTARALLWNVPGTFIISNDDDDEDTEKKPALT